MGSLKESNGRRFQVSLKGDGYDCLNEVRAKLARRKDFFRKLPSYNDVVLELFRVYEQERIRRE